MSPSELHRAAFRLYQVPLGEPMLVGANRCSSGQKMLVGARGKSVFFNDCSIAARSFDDYPGAAEYNGQIPVVKIGVQTGIVVSSNPLTPLIAKLF